MSRTTAKKLLRCGRQWLRVTPNTPGNKKRYAKLYGVWQGMNARCNNPNHRGYMRYGGRGIRVCPEWSDYAVFRTWALANGYRKGLSIERKNNNSGYSPKNCTWIPLAAQSKNRKSNRGEVNGSNKLTSGQVIMIRQDPRTQQAIADDYGVHNVTIHEIKSGKTWGWLKC